jgi:hypothetical protein
VVDISGSVVLDLLVVKALVLVELAPLFVVEMVLRVVGKARDVVEGATNLVVLALLVEVPARIAVVVERVPTLVLIALLVVLLGVVLALVVVLVMKVLCAADCVINSSTLQRMMCQRLSMVDLS